MSKKTISIKPLGDRVLISPIETEEKTMGGIILPDTAKEEKAEGIVIAVSSYIETISSGDRVIFGKYAGDEIEQDGKKFKIISEEDILAIIEK